KKPRRIALLQIIEHYFNGDPIADYVVNCKSQKVICVRNPKQRASREGPIFKIKRMSKPVFHGLILEVAPEFKNTRPERHFDDVNRAIDFRKDCAQSTMMCPHVVN